jgi:hypothetical protein
MTSKDKIQYLLITHLLKEGQIQLTLPDGLTVRLGVTAETKRGLEKCDNYCWLEAEQDDRQISLDSRNLGLHFGKDRLVFEGRDQDSCVLEVV